MQGNCARMRENLKEQSAMYYEYLANKIKKFFPNIPENKIKEFEARRENEALQRKNSYAFLAYGMSEICNIDILEAIPCITDGGGDAQIDAIYIQIEDNFSIHFFQSKYFSNNNKTIGENEIRLTLESVDTIFKGQTPARLSSLVQDKIQEIKEAITDNGYPNIFIHFLSNGEKIPHNVIEDLQKRYDGYEICNYGAKEIAEYSLTPSKKDFECSLTSIGNVSENLIAGINGYIATVDARKFIEIYKQHGRQKLLDRNIRYYKGLNTINKKIQATAESQEESKFFWFINNGVSLVCDGIAPLVGDGNGNQILKIKNPMIINGGQTTETLAQSNIDQNTRILLRIYVLTEDSIIAKITEGTNSQNPINFRDLKANNKTQRLIQQYFLDHQVFLEIKSGETPTKSQKIRDEIKNDFLIQAYVAIYKDNPSDAKTSKMAVLRRYFDEIFKNEENLPFEFFRSYEIIKFVNHNNSGEAFFPHAIFCICYAMAKLKSKILEKDFDFEQDREKLNETFSETVQIIKNIIIQKQEELEDAYSHNYLFKSKEIKILIDKAIHKLRH